MIIREIWRSIKGYEGLYLISNLGNIKSVTKVVNSPRQKSYNVEGKMLKKIVNQTGYYKRALCKDSNVKHFVLHRLVAETFVLNHDNKPFVNHIDGNRLNNNAWNLEWVTSRENNSHTQNNKRKSKYAGVSSHWATKKWSIQLNVNKKKYWEGPFNTQEEALSAYIELCKRHGVKNKYSTEFASRTLWKRPYYIQPSPNYINR